jgi:Zn-dependent protease
MVRRRVKWSYRLATVAGIQVRVHLTFLLLLGFYAWVYYLDGGLKAAASGVTLTLLIFLCVLLHEFGHAFAAKIFGIATPDITLLPIGGIARLARMPANPWQELAICDRRTGRQRAHRDLAVVHRRGESAGLGVFSH